jgi:D-alanyl-D-alanine carboxypeptidase
MHPLTKMFPEALEVLRGTRSVAALALAVGLALLAGACGSREAGSSLSATIQAPAGTTSVGRAQAAYAATLQPTLQQIFTDTLTPGAAVLVRSPELGDWTAIFGTRALGSTEPITLADHVRIGSNTKTWTGTVILQLVQEGTLSLDDPVSKYRPEVPNGRNITITELLNMRSGLYNYSESLELNQTLDTNPTKVWTPDELLAIAYKNPPYFPPGQGYHYSNTNMVLLGLIIEKLTSNPVEQEFQMRIFKPLGLYNTQLPPRTSNTLPTPYPNGYQFGSNVETMTSQVLSPDQQAAAKTGILKPLDATHQNPSWGWTAGSGISTAKDLARYAQALVGGGLLSEAMQKKRLASIRPINPDDPTGPGYGLALARFGSVYGHTGELPGYNSFMGYDPERKITIIVWTSLAAAPDGRAPAVEMAKAIIGHLYGGQLR